MFVDLVYNNFVGYQILYPIRFRIIAPIFRALSFVTSLYKKLQNRETLEPLLQQKALLGPCCILFLLQNLQASLYVYIQKLTAANPYLVLLLSLQFGCASRGELEVFNHLAIQLRVENVMVKQTLYLLDIMIMMTVQSVYYRENKLYRRMLVNVLAS